MYSQGVIVLRKENELAWVDTEKKRVKKDLGSRIDDLLNEVNSMRFVYIFLFHGDRDGPPANQF